MGIWSVDPSTMKFPGTPSLLLMVTPTRSGDVYRAGISALADDGYLLASHVLDGQTTYVNVDILVVGAATDLICLAERGRIDRRLNRGE